MASLTIIIKNDCLDYKAVFIAMHYIVYNIYNYICIKYTIIYT